MPHKFSISEANSYQGIGEFWYEHDASEFGEQRAADFAVDIQSERRYYPIDKEFSSKRHPNSSLNDRRPFIGHRVHAHQDVSTIPNGSDLFDENQNRIKTTTNAFVTPSGIRSHAPASSVPAESP
jgi:hypothetical protein